MANKLASKVTLLEGHSNDLSACTFAIDEEDHTLGNAIRYILMKNPDVEFCGYSAPHPSEYKIHLRIQMYDGKSAVDALSTGLGNLEDLFKTLRDKYTQDLEKKDYEWVEQEQIDWDQVTAKAKANKEAKFRARQGGR